MSYTCIRIEGGLISPDFLEAIHEHEGQKAADFGLDPKRSVIDEVSSIWADARTNWTTLQRRLERKKDESETTLTREQWIIPLLEALGYQLTFQRKAPEVDGRAYAISHIAGTEESAPPVHIVGTDQELGSRPPAGRGTMSPHALVQDYLNRTEHLWGVVTNGRVFRLLRDSSYFTRPTYIEFDLEQMLEGERLDEFFLFYRLAHRTRLPEGIDDAPRCLIERYHQDAIEQGGRIRDGLRDAVEAAIRQLGNGFLKHPRNQTLRDRIKSGELTADSYYKQLLYLIYRMLFLVVAEERGLLSMSAKRLDEKKALYSEYFSFARLRKLADTPLSAPARFDDLYLGFRGLCFALRDEKLSDQLGLPPLNGELFNPLPDLEESFINNENLLKAVASFSYFTPKDGKVRRRINYAALDVEELGSVYESLLEYQPVFSKISDMPEFDFIAGTERKTTGSYYTRPELVKELVKSALMPVIEDRLADARKSKQDEEKALLSIRVCDPACGSGHFLLAAARRIAYELARVRAKTEEPSPDTVRAASRDVITHCIYGVDKNPLAVDLCKVALWIEGHGANKPLTFLDHRIRCGDSLVGVLNMEALGDGIPDAAYDPVPGDDKSVAKDLKQRNKKERKGERALPFEAEQEEAELSGLLQPILELSDDTPEEVRKKRKAFGQIHSKGTKLWHDEAACNLWTGAFFSDLTSESRDARQIPTTDSLLSFMENEDSVDARLPAHAWQMQSEHRYFHWPLEFPDVFEKGGFDVVLCNPPWEILELNEREFFATRVPSIAEASNASRRATLIQRLQQENPTKWLEYQKELHYYSALRSFLHYSGRFPMTGKGRINSYSVFAELFSLIIKPEALAGIIVPTGIATDNTNKDFFGSLVKERKLISLFDFENREGMFQNVHRSYKFSVLTLRGASDAQSSASQFAFFLSNTRQLNDDKRVFWLSAMDIERLNPNTLTCPVFRTSVDANLTKDIYENVPVLHNDKTHDNAWDISYKQGLFNMASDSHYFRTREELEAEGYHLAGSNFVRCDETWLPLYEAKMVWIYNHQYGSYEGREQRGYRVLPPITEEQHGNADYLVMPWYWVSEEQVNAKLKGTKRKWLVGFRDIAQAMLERTAVFSLIPKVGVGDKLPLVLFPESTKSTEIACFVCNVSSLVFDYVARQKVGGTNLGYFILKQLPVIAPHLHNPYEIVPSFLELVYFSWDLKQFADDVWRDSDESLRIKIKNQWENNKAAAGGHKWAPPGWAHLDTEGIPLPPFKWDEDRRALFRAELDAYYAKLYGLTEEELRYILDPTDVYGPDFPGETFRVLKEKEIKQYGEYRTRRLVLEAWEKQH